MWGNNYYILQKILMYTFMYILAMDPKLMLALFNCLTHVVCWCCYLCTGPCSSTHFCPFAIIQGVWCICHFPVLQRLGQVCIPCSVLWLRVFFLNASHFCVMHFVAAHAHFFWSSALHCIGSLIVVDVDIRCFNFSASLAKECMPFVIEAVVLSFVSVEISIGTFSGAIFIHSGIIRLVGFCWFW